MDPNSSCLVRTVTNKIKSDFGIEEYIAETLVQIGRKSETTAEEFSLLSKEIFPGLSHQQALLIFDTIRKNFPPRPEKPFDFDSSVMNFSVRLAELFADFSFYSPVVDFKHAHNPNAKGWLTRIASDRTAIMKNLADPVPDRNTFPIFGSKDEILRPASEIRALVLISKTICGDSTRVAQYLQKAEAEISTAKRVNQEKSSLDDQDILLKRISADENLSDYSAVVINRRTATTDILFGMFKKLFLRRSDFLLILDSSATVERGNLSRFFSGCQVLDLQRITYPVQIQYLKQPISDYLYSASILAVEIHVTSKTIGGDIIVFLAGEEEIDPVRRLMIERMRIIQRSTKAPELVILPVFYSKKNDPRMFESESNRRVILTTNTAEALFEFDNIRYVIDCGLEKRDSKNPKQETNSIVVAPISKDSALKRAGRAGRVKPWGKCYRLYTEAAFLEMGPTTLPEILRTNLGEAILRMKALKREFDFVDPPSTVTIVDSSRQLYCLGALGDNGNITSLGKSMAEFPVGPVHSKTLVAAASVDFRCSDEALTIVAMVLAGNVFNRPEDEERRAEADLKRVGFFQPGGDHLTLLAVFEGWKENGFSSQWCLDNFIDFESMNRAKEFRNELVASMNRLELEIVSAEKDYTKIRKAIAAGLFFHAAKWDPQERCYRAVTDNQRVHINSRSALFDHQNPSCVVFEDLHVKSGDRKEYMIGVTAVDPDWLHELAPLFFRVPGPMRTAMSQREKRGCGGPESESKRFKPSG